MNSIGSDYEILTYKVFFFNLQITNNNNSNLQNEMNYNYL